MNLPRHLRFTRFGTYVVLITLGVGFGAMNTGNNLAYIVFGMMLGFITASGVYSEMSLRGLKTDWIFQPEIFSGSPAVFRLTLKNNKARLPSIGLALETPFGRGTVLHVPPQSHAALDFSFTPRARGRHEISQVKVETKFPFGFFRKWLVDGGTQSFIVYPKIDLRRDLEARLPPGDKNRAVREKGRGDAFWQMKDFFEGDNPRQISWKVSARRARLMVRETEKETDKKISFEMEPRELWRGMAAEDLESALSFAASMVWKKLGEGFAVGFQAEDFFMAPTSSRRKASGALRYLALFDPASPPAGGAAGGRLPEALPLLALWKARPART